MKHFRNNAKGFALLLVMWALFIMSFSIIGLLTLLNVDIGNASGMERVAVASSLALSGITLGRNVDFPVNGKTEKQSFAEGGVLEVRAISENGKLNVNRLLAREERETLHALFRIWGLSDGEADTVLDCLLDYVQPGTARRLNGAKADQYRAAGRQPPPGRPFRSVDEMAHVLNFELVTNRKGDWRDYFTIYGDGTLDLTAAALDVIRAVCGIGDVGAKSVQSGASGFVDMDAVRRTMGFTEKEFEAMQERLSLGGKIRRIRSTGTFANVAHTIEVICQTDGITSSILEWREW